MKRTIYHTLILTAALALSTAVRAADETAVTEAPAVEKVASSKIGAQLKGHLIQIVDGAATEASPKSDVEYFVLYHSASW